MRLTFQHHEHCTALSESVRGSVCTVVFTASPRMVRAGDRVFNAGDGGRKLFLLRSGLIKLTALSAAGDEVILQVYRPGDIFGELCFCGHERQHTAFVLEPSEVIEATDQDVLSALQGHPALVFELLETITARLAGAYSQLQDSFSDVILNRIASKLLALIAPLEGVATLAELPYQFSHADLAQMVGVRRETITRAMGDLRRLGLIAYARQGRVSVDLVKLREFLARSDRAAV